MAFRYDPVSLRVFVRVAQTGSLSAAAARIPLALAAVSRRLLQLEEDAGVPLLKRLPRGIALTAAGETLLRHAQEVEQSYRQLRADMTHLRNGGRGTVRLAANNSCVLQFLPRDIRRFRECHPDLRIDLQELTSDAVLQALRAGTAEIGICEIREPEGVADLDVRPYARDRLVLLVPSDHRWRRRRKISFAEALAAEFVIGMPGTALRSLIVASAHAAGHPLQISMQVRGFEGASRMVAAGLGVAVLPEKAVAMEAKGTVHAVQLTDAWAVRQHYVAHRHEAQLAAPARLFAASVPAAGTLP